MTGLKTQTRLNRCKSKDHKKRELNYDIKNFHKHFCKTKLSVVETKTKNNLFTKPFKLDETLI